MRFLWNGSLTGLLPLPPFARQTFFLNLLHYNCLKYVGVYFCACCISASRGIGKCMFMYIVPFCVWLCGKTNFPVRCKDPGSLKENRATPWPWLKTGLDQYARLEVSSCQCGNLFTYCRPCFAGYFPMALYIKLSHIVCEPPIVACGSSLWKF
jgi:hypothetical protein